MPEARSPRPETRDPQGLLILTFALACASAPVASAPPVSGDIFDPALGIDLAAMERTETGLYVQTLREGMGRAARSGQEVRVHYKGWLSNGVLFDSSYQRQEPIEVTIGRGIVIDAWDQGIAGMRVGEVRRLVVPPELGYGAEGAPGAIPTDATLVFEIELLGFP